eukprot:TRINITY_DN404_c1_g1_i2.p1 TRINITY_DN404_c1_g1~~TRINITY_DN404_c1_g1_i2.p1  ORF type:complete len:426 (+),score=102.57 TRINITY_DN404_c1_g1_i2:161-1438(+)
MDETYCHQHHHAQSGFIDPDHPPPKISRGARWIIVHAITKDGLLFTRNNGLFPEADNEVDDGTDSHTLNTERELTDREYQARSTKDTRPSTKKVNAERPLDAPTTCISFLKYKLNCHIINSGESFYPAYSNSADYHDNMDGEMFMLWVQNRLFPAFQAKYGYDMKMFLILDNAPYHWGHNDDYINTNDTTKKFTKNFLLNKFFEDGSNGLYDESVFDAAEFKVTVTRTINNNTVEVEYSTYGQIFKNFSKANANDPNKCGLSVTELRRVFGDWLNVHCPHRTKTELQNFFDKTYEATGVKHELIFTPPFCPQYQPIELVWAQVKNFVASTNFPGRTKMQLFTDICTAFYGGTMKIHNHTLSTDGVTPLNCQNYIRHMLYECNKSIALDAHLSGTIHDLVYPGGDVLNEDGLDAAEEVEVANLKVS